MPRCPKCRCHFRVPEDEDSGHTCPRCGYDANEEAEREREWDAQDFADDAMDRANKIESESR